MAKINLLELKKRVADRLINEQKHPEADLYIYNYTPIAQFKRKWDEYTLQARGLILDGEGNIIARPFNKFFNYQEHMNPELPKIPLEEYVILEKMDGSLGILYKIDGKPYLATRGSFTSDQALMGTKILQTRYADFDFKDGYTYLFEIIYPENRIVVDYKGLVDIVLLDMIDTETGKSIELTDEFPFPKVVQFPMKPLEKLVGLERDNAEGFVIKFYPSDFRIKLKHQEYVRLHRLLTQVSSKSIWELLKNDEPLEPILDNIPDEFYQWVMDTMKDLQSKQIQIRDEALESLRKVPKGISRKEQAAFIFKELPNPPLIFSLLDGKTITEQVWKMIKPKYEQPFRKDIDA